MTGPFWYTVTSSREIVYCEACDRLFKDERELYRHNSNHEICGRDGCMYSAHPKLVAKHVKMQHETGLYKRIGKLNTEEEITRWIEERKRRYPTRKVVEEKKAILEEKIKRGERIKEDNSKFNKSFTKKKERRRRNSLKKTVKKKSSSRKKTDWEVGLTIEEALNEEKSWRGTIPPFSGITNRDTEDDSIHMTKSVENNKTADNISDEEWEVTSETKEKQPVNNSLGLLATFYDSASSIEEAPEEVKTIRVKEELIPEERLQHEKRRRGRSKRRKIDEDDKEKSNPQPKRKRELTLLEKLLSREIRHERNVILQCVRYVVNNNFFAENRKNNESDVQI